MILDLAEILTLSVPLIFTCTSNGPAEAKPVNPETGLVCSDCAEALKLVAANINIAAKIVNAALFMIVSFYIRCDGLGKCCMGRDFLFGRIEKAINISDFGPDRYRDSISDFISDSPELIFLRKIVVSNIRSTVYIMTKN